MEAWIGQAITEEFGGKPIEFGWCSKHDDLAKLYEDGGMSCWWESVVEANGYHVDSDFVAGVLVSKPERVELTEETQRNYLCCLDDNAPSKHDPVTETEHRFVSEWLPVEDE